MHGRFRVKKDEAGRDTVFTNEGSPLSDVAQLGKNEAAASAGRAISAQELKQAIHTKAQAQTEHPAIKATLVARVAPQAGYIAILKHPIAVTGFA